MFYQLDVRVPLTDAWLEVTTYDRHRCEADSAMQMAHGAGDVVRDANKPSASLYQAPAYQGGLDRLLGTPSALEQMLAQDNGQGAREHP